jgi:hypothetical protein
MGDVSRLTGLRGGREPKQVVVREYGRDSLLVWANLLLAPLLAALGMRVGVQSDEHLMARIEADAASMRQRGYAVSSIQTFALPIFGAAKATARWYRVTYKLL